MNDLLPETESVPADVYTIHIDPTTRWEVNSERYEYEKYWKSILCKLIPWLIITILGILLIVICNEKGYFDTNPTAPGLILSISGMLFLCLSAFGIIILPIQYVIDNYVNDPDQQKPLDYSYPIHAIMVISNIKTANTLKKVKFKEDWFDSYEKTKLPSIDTLVSCGFISEACGYRLNEIYTPYKKIYYEKREIQQCSPDTIGHTESLRVAYVKLKEEEEALQIRYEKLHGLMVENLPEPIYESDV